MTVALKNRTNVFLSTAYSCASFCIKAIETALKSRFVFVLFSVSIAALTAAALGGIVFGVVNTIAVFQKVVDVFRDVLSVLFG